MGEATIICLDNSDWTRNGDYYPNRWISQVETYNLLLDIKRQQNMETTLGALLMSGSRPELLLPPTTLLDKLIEVVKNAQIAKQSDIQLYNSLMIASMALKYRSNKVQKQKIIAFICSPLSQTDIKLIPEIAKILKKALIGLDIVNLLESNKAFLVSLVDQVNVSGNSNIIDCSGKGMAISDAVLASPIASQGNAPQMMNPENNGGNVNFQEDPELAEAIRMSLAEAQRKEEAPKKQAEPKEAKAKEPAKEEPVIEELTEEEMMKKALEMSMQISQPQPMEEVKVPSETDALLDPDFLQEAIKKITGTTLTKEENAIDKKEESKKSNDADTLLDPELIQKTIKNITGTLKEV